jgi:hypothetical protein
MIKFHYLNNSKKHNISVEHIRDIQTAVSIGIPDFLTHNNWRYGIQAIAVPEDEQLRFIVNLTIRNTTHGVYVYEDVYISNPVSRYVKVSPLFTDFVEAKQHFIFLCEQFEKQHGINLLTKPNRTKAPRLSPKKETFENA